MVEKQKYFFYGKKNLQLSTGLDQQVVRTVHPHV